MVGPSPRTTQPLGGPEAEGSESGGGRNMHRASAPSSPLSSPEYYERLGRLRHGLRDRYGRDGESACSEG